MKKDRNFISFIAWSAFGIALGTSIIRLYLLITQSNSNVSSSTIDLVTFFGYALSILLAVFYVYKKYKK